jgi:hypothetical protein
MTSGSNIPKWSNLTKTGNERHANVGYKLKKRIHMQWGLAPDLEKR